MERHRRQLMLNRRSWGDSMARDSAQSGSLPTETSDHCMATYKAAAARLDHSAMNSTPPQQPLISPDPKFISVQGWSIDHLLSISSNFVPVRRISSLNKAALNPSELEKYDKNGIPLIIEDFHKSPHWPQEFNLEKFKSHGPSNITVRNVLNGTDSVMPTAEFINKCRASTTFVSEHDKERLYGKDVECPKEWQKLLPVIGIPTYLLPGSDYDLLFNQPSEERVQTLMCYLGIGDTFTPCHKDLCASSGQNLMCYTENNGSSFWFMTATEDVFDATTYFHSINKELDHECSIVTVEELSKAPFPVYIAEQKLGDFVLVPSRSCHQVINQGGITVKTSWSRMTLDGLITAYYHELPIYQRIVRAETYRVKYTIYHTLRNFTEKIGQKETVGRTARLAAGGNSYRKRLLNSLRALLKVYDDVLSDEIYHPDAIDKISLVVNPPAQPSSLSKVADDRITCDFCEADVFQSFFECRWCVENPEQVAPGDGCIICPRCYTDGRSCRCGSMNPMQCRPFDVLLKARDEATELLKKFDSYQVVNNIHPEEKPDKLGVFAAGCLKNKVNDFSATRKCSAQGVGHVVRKFNSLYCNGCRRTSCFQHLLAKYDTHAVDALLDSASLDDQQYHKSCHSSSRSCITEQDVTEFAGSVKRGSCPDTRFQRYHLATFYTRCLPASKYVRRGYYDEGWDSTEQSACTRPTVQRTYLENLGSTSRLSPLSSISEFDQQWSLDQIPGIIKEPPKSQKSKRLVLDCVEILRCRAMDKREQLPKVEPSGVKQSQVQPEIETTHSGLVPILISELMDSGSSDELSRPASSTAHVAGAMGNDSSTRMTDTLVGENIPMDVSAGNVAANERNKSSSEGSRTKVGSQDLSSESRRHGAKIKKATRSTTRVQSQARNKQTTIRKVGGRIRVGDAGTNGPDPANEHVRQMLVKDPIVPSSEDSDAAAASHPGATGQFNTPGIPPPIISNRAARNQGDDSDTAVAPQWPESKMLPEISTVRTMAPENPARIPGESSSTQHTNFAARNETGRKKNYSTAITRPRSSSTTSLSITSIDDESARPPKRPRLDSTGVRPSRRGRRRVEDEALDDYGPRLAAALNIASTANQNSPTRTKRRDHIQVEMDARSPTRDHERPILDECPQPPLTTESKEEYERKIRELESRLALVEAQNQPKQIADQVIDAVFNRMKDNGFPHAVTPQTVYLAPLSLLGPSEGGLNYYMPNEQHNNYRAHHNGNPRFYPHSREPNFQPGWNSPHQVDQHWRNHPTGPRQDFRNRQHHNNNFNHRPVQRLGMQRGRRYGDFNNRERPSGGESDNFNNRRSDDNGFRFPRSEETDQNDLSQRTRHVPGLSDLDRQRGDALLGPSELRQRTLENAAGPSSSGIDSVPRRPLTPSYPEHDDTPRTEHVQGQGSQQVASSRNSLRSGNNELTCDWEENYDLDDRDSDANKKGNYEVHRKTETNPWVS